MLKMARTLLEEKAAKGSGTLGTKRVFELAATARTQFLDSWETGISQKSV
jgi:hypothetical protein